MGTWTVKCKVKPQRMGNSQNNWARPPSVSFTHFKAWGEGRHELKHRYQVTSLAENCSENLGTPSQAQFPAPSYHGEISHKLPRAWPFCWDGTSAIKVTEPQLISASLDLMTSFVVMLGKELLVRHYALDLGLCLWLSRYSALTAMPWQQSLPLGINHKVWDTVLSHTYSLWVQQILHI